MGKKKKDGRALGGLAGAFVKAGIADTKAANKARADRRDQEKGLSREELARREAEQLAAQREAQRAQADSDRRREAEAQRGAALERLHDLIRMHRDPARGPKRFFFVARDGRVPFVDVNDQLVRQLTNGQAGIVESMGVVPEEHVVLVDAQALAALRAHDAELVRFWNAGPEHA